MDLGRIGQHLKNKLQRCAYKLLKLLARVAIPVIRWLSPWILIRFGKLYSERIGHFLIETDLNLSERSLGLCPAKSWDWFYTGEVCNPSLAKVYSRSLFLHSFVRILDEVNRKRPGGEAHYFTTTRLSLIHI